MGIKVNTKGFEKAMKLAEKELGGIAKDAHAFFVKQTPIRSGNARKNTNLNNNKIEARYAYADRLDQGYSKQRPDGMIEPTMEHIEKVLVPSAIRRVNRG
jgi:hypothetical protein